MGAIKVTDQAELDAALARLTPTDWIECAGDGEFTAYGSATVRAYGSATVTAYDSATVRASDSATVTAYDSATVRAYGSATVRAYDSATVRASDSATVRAYGSATVRAYGSATVTAYDSATVRAYGSATVTAYGSATVTAYDSATVRAYGSATVTASDSATVRAYGSATVTASGSATVRASRYVAVQRHITAFGSPTVVGGVVIDIPRPRTAEEWCDLHGVDVTDGVAVLFKAVDDDWSTDQARAKGITYAPGSTPEAPDWDGGKAECGGGLHFTAHPWEALEFNADATRFVACPVALSDIAVRDDASMPSKVKAHRVCAPTWAVDIDGVRVDEVAS